MRRKKIKGGIGQPAIKFHVEVEIVFLLFNNIALTVNHALKYNIPNELVGSEQ